NELRNLHQPAHRFVVKDLTIARENRGELETKHFMKTAADLLVTLDLFFRRLTVQTRGLENDWRSSMLDDLIDFPAVKCNNITLESLDVRTSDKLCIRG